MIFFSFVIHIIFLQKYIIILSNLILMKLIEMSFVDYYKMVQILKIGYR